MKRLFFILLPLLFFLLRPAAAAPVIHYDHQRFNADTMTYELTGNVSVATEERTISADKAIVSFLSNDLRASGHVRLIQDGLTFTGQEAYVSGARHNAEIKEPLRFDRDGLSITADEGTYDWKTKEARFKGHVVYQKGKETGRRDSLIYNVKTGQLS